jgi:hypothetical protein
MLVHLTLLFILSDMPISAHPVKDVLVRCTIVSRQMRELPSSSFAAIVVVAVVGIADLGAQPPPPIQGVTGRIATATSVAETTAGGNRVLAKLGSLFGLKRKAASNDAAAEEALSGLKKGTRIVLHPASAENGPTDERSKQVEGEVVAVNRSDRTVSITLEDGTRQTLRLSDPGDAAATNVIVYYKDRPDLRIAHPFKRVS